MSQTITRSTGVPVRVGGMPYLVGSGYRGETDELDEVVVRAAKMLAETFNRHVEIRFNSNRESGGAWLKNSLKGFEGNCQVGLGADLRPKTPEGISHWDFLTKSSLEFIRNQPKELCIDTYVDQSALKDPTLCNSGFPDSRYCSLTHPNLKAGLEWLKANVDTDKLYD